MELRAFIKDTLEQIVAGVSDANAAITAQGGVINPSSMSFHEGGKNTVHYHPMPQTVEFDIALETISRAGGTEGVGVFMGAVNLGKRNDKSDQSTALTKVKFTVPLVLPPGKGLIKES